LIKRLIYSLLALTLVIAIGVGFWTWQGLQTLKNPVALNEPVLFEVPSGTSFNRVAFSMAEQGLVEDSLWLRIHVRVEPADARIKAGQYEFVDGMSPRQMLSMMVRGDVKHWSVTIIEGWTFAEMRQALADASRLQKQTGEWTDAQVMEALGAEGQHPEGRFFPDTYAFTSQESDLDILRRAHERMQSVLEEEWQNRAEGLPYDTPYEALIMASIVERETGVPYERGEIAGVFVRRLQKGMRLQTDPTVIYGMGDKYQGRITSRDLRTHTPYNTYRIDGLPPTPIALPGRGAVHASLNPEPGDSLYFVARGDGTHKFSKTLAEHQRAVREFQLNRRSDYRSFPAPETEGEGD
jgi:UPF0755 protein